MSVKPVLRMGNQQLLEPSSLVEDFAMPELHRIVQDMQDTMQKEGSIGIAAPQIGVNKRIIMFGFEKSVRHPNERPVPFTILINPVIEPLSEETVEAWEACLSLPGLRGLVPRYKHIRYSGYDPEGNAISRVVEGFHARMLQHETDHLDGILYTQHIKDIRNFGFHEEIMEKVSR
jgi:peptide deformylase